MAKKVMQQQRAASAASAASEETSTSSDSSSDSDDDHSETDKKIETLLERQDWLDEMRKVAYLKYSISHKNLGFLLGDPKRFRNRSFGQKVDF